MDLLNDAENLTGTFLFWFDLHRLVALALDRLGALFLAPREVVGRELVAFLDRFPGMTALTFSDGTPFVEPMTQTFLDEERAKWAPSGAAGGGGPAVVITAPLASKIRDGVTMSSRPSPVTSAAVTCSIHHELPTTGIASSSAPVTPSSTPVSTITSTAPS